jgi:malonate-semialdehyde dehydrogenase (acetylating)/methylmalonate-semialdehyde dehydrogenase
MERLKNYVNGQWIQSQSSEYLDIENPGTGEIFSQVPLSTAAEADFAVESAHRAFPEWSSTPVARRVSYLYSFLELVQKNENLIARALVKEMGKSIPDAMAEMKRLIENVQVACGMPVMQQGDKVMGSSFDIDGEVLRLPLGVFTLIAPFNFPAMVPFWFIPYALATGNTYVMKPSEQVPCTMQLITEYFNQAGLPPGVFNLVNGDKSVAAAFMENKLVKGVSMVGSSRVCRLVAETCSRHNKRYQALGSAKNHLVVMPDARIDEVVRNMITSCYGCAGQRCMAASAIICVGDETYKTVCERFVEASKKVIVANPLDEKYADEPVLVGPVISSAAKSRIHALIEDGIAEGATLALDGRGMGVTSYEKGHYIGPTVFTDVKPGMNIHETEIFGPVVVILRAASLDEAIAIINDHEYGNGASIYTQSGYWARKFKLETQAGMIGINIGIPAPVAYLPFGGMKTSIFADIKAQGKAVVNFFTTEKIITERYWAEK